MAQPNQESIQESSEDSTSPNSIQVFYHVLNKVLKIKKHEVVSISKWMKYMGYNNFTDLCVDRLIELNYIHDFSSYIVDGQYSALKLGTMNKLKLFIRWMSTRMKGTTLTPLTSQTSGSKKRQAFLSQHNDLLDEPVFESTETLLDQEKVASSHVHLLNLLLILLEASKDLPEFIFTFMTIILYLKTHLKMWINHVISVTPPAPLIVWVNPVD